MALAFQRDISQPFPRSGLAYDDRNFWYGHSTNFHSEPSKIVRTNTDNTISLSVEYFQSVPRLIHDSFFSTLFDSDGEHISFDTHELVVFLKLLHSSHKNSDRPKQSALLFFLPLVLLLSTHQTFDQLSLYS